MTSSAPLNVETPDTLSCLVNKVCPVTVDSPARVVIPATLKLLLKFTASTNVDKPTTRKLLLTVRSPKLVSSPILITPV